MVMALDSGRSRVGASLPWGQLACKRVSIVLNATLFQFRIDVVDSDRGHYETVDVRLAQHPSESRSWLAARALAYALEHCDTMGCSRGVCVVDEPPVYARDLEGRYTLWVEIGLPVPARLDVATRASPRVCVYAHRPTGAWWSKLCQTPPRLPERIDVYALDPQFIEALADRLAHRTAWMLTVTGGHLYATVNDEVFDAPYVATQIGGCAAV